ncbi:helix-turn-helix domain-containing protein [Saccharothrix xinjiangensis]|uniref:Helix-turn-helix domain-containing protein n=1 Tax=Saccharothrix xinjiangensis TaxID=204798 RepID=A0ABV9XYD7_9PSEU
MTTDPSRSARRDSFLERCLCVLEVIAGEPGPLTLVRIGELTDLPVTTVHRLVRALEDSEVLERIGRRYRIGGRLVAIATRHAPGTTG